MASKRAKPIIGLCGGIGSGKSLVAQELARLGAVVIDSDRLGHEALARPEVVARLREWWGAEVLDAGGRPDRARIARIVFGDGEARRRLEGLIHPLIAAARADIIRRSVEDPAVSAIVLDSPLLLEFALDRLCDEIVFVEASESARLERVERTRGWDVRELERRSGQQWPLERKRARASEVLVNEGSPDDLRARVADLFQRILARHASR